MKPIKPEAVLHLELTFAATEPGPVASRRTQGQHTPRRPGCTGCALHSSGECHAHSRTSAVCVFIMTDFWEESASRPELTVAFSNLHERTVYNSSGARCVSFIPVFIN